MSSSPQDQAIPGNAALEDRLRGLILSNNQPVTADVPTSENVLSVSPGVSKKTGNLGMKSTSHSPSASEPSVQLTPGGRKRLNQSQRRQMNAQISIPVDARSAPTQRPAEKGFSLSTGFSRPARPHGNYSQQQVQSRSHPSPGSGRSHNYSSASQNTSQTQFQYQTARQNIYQPYMQYGQDSWHQNPQANAVTPSFNSIHNQSQRNDHYLSNQYGGRPSSQHGQLYQPGPYGGNGRHKPFEYIPGEFAAQTVYLDKLIDRELPKVGMGEEEVLEKEKFRATVEQICQAAIAGYEQNEGQNPTFNLMSVQLKCFGSMASGFATKASDMDLALLTPYSHPPPNFPESAIPRLLEKKLLDMGFGARLLTKTRVPIIKLCQKPTPKLKSDLLEERQKWENGFITDDKKDCNDHVEELERSQDIVEKVFNDPPTGKAVTSLAETCEHGLKSLRQKSGESLGDYYLSANRLLRKMGGHDIEITRSRQSSPAELKIAADVCQAFIGGLSDEKLKDRLAFFQSLSYLKDTPPTKLGSLRVIFAQMEGEQLAMLWNSRSLREATEAYDAECGRYVEEWNKLVHKVDVDPFSYHGMLHQAVGKLKRIGSLQILFLEQGLHENPVQYRERVSKLVSQLGGESKDNVLAMAVAHYISGISNPKIREALQAKTSQDESLSLQSVALQHRILQLAEDFEQALSKNLYSEANRADVKQYIRLLRTGQTDSIEEYSPSLRLNRSISPLVNKIRFLSDPSLVAQKSRDRYKDHLEFPKKEVGIQCDINFSAQLGIHNTLLLRCYSLTDSRVKPLVLFVKHWAKTRAINTPYRGSLSSYGYVLMVLHYLVHVATPFVCPNLQQLYSEPPSYPSPSEIAYQTTCNGYDVRFWRNETEIASLADKGMINNNDESLGKLLHGFFEYYAQQGPLTSGGRGFDWGREVLSLRTIGGLLTKQQKGWVGARTETETRIEAAPVSSIIQPQAFSTSHTADPTSPRKLILKEQVREIRHRYLFAIEDPFELDHNVARTVTHNGIVSIRDEFRRAWRIIRSTGKGPAQEDFLAEVGVESGPQSGLQDLMDQIHGQFESQDGK